MKEINIEDLLFAGKKVFIPLAENINTASFAAKIMEENPGLRRAKYKVGINNGRVGIHLWIDKEDLNPDN